MYDSTVADKHKLTIQGNGTFGAIEAASGAAEAAKSGIEVTSGHFAKPVNEDYWLTASRPSWRAPPTPRLPTATIPAWSRPGRCPAGRHHYRGKRHDWQDEVHRYPGLCRWRDGEQLYTVTEGTELTLPTPSRSGYTFELV